MPLYSAVFDSRLLLKYTRAMRYAHARAHTILSILTNQTPWSLFIQLTHSSYTFNLHIHLHAPNNWLIIYFATNETIGGGRQINFPGVRTHDAEKDLALADRAETSDEADDGDDAADGDEEVRDVLETRVALVERHELEQLEDVLVDEQPDADCEHRDSRQLRRRGEGEV